MSFVACAGPGANTGGEAKDAPLLAVLELRNKLEGEQRKAVDAAYLTDVLRAAALETAPRLRVMTHENVLVLLQASGKTLEDCEGECEVDIGRKLGADLVVSGDILRFGSSFQLNLKLHDTHSGRLLSAQQAGALDVDDLGRAPGPAMVKLLAPVSGFSIARAAAPPRPRHFAVRAGLGTQTGILGVGFEYRPGPVAIAVGTGAYALSGGLSLAAGDGSGGWYGDLHGTWSRHGLVTKFSGSGWGAGVSAGYDFRPLPWLSFKTGLGAAYNSVKTANSRLPIVVDASVGLVF